MSMTARPVTQTADAEENRASTKLRCRPLAANGIRRRTAPIRIKEAKLRMKIRGGVSRREIEVRMRQQEIYHVCS